MGLPMARNLLNKGEKLVVYDLSEQQMKEAVKDGAVAANGPADVARQSSTIFTMLPDGYNMMSLTVHNIMYNIGMQSNGCIQGMMVYSLQCKRAACVLIVVLSMVK
jgi:3-hydroxyisobutyrate dehydrogenase-like beta-hydroxyacid dehydrogenase